MRISTRSRVPTESYSCASRFPNSPSPLRESVNRSWPHLLDGREQHHGVPRRLEVVNPQNLGGAAGDGETGGGERPGKALLQRSAEHLAEEALPGHTEADRSAVALKLVEAGQQAEV